MRVSGIAAGVVGLAMLGIASLDARQTARALPPNTLTPAEVAAGWKLLFDGKTFTGWRGFHRDAFPDKGWIIADESISHLKGVTAGDIITVDEFENFEFRADWKLVPGGNSGIKYLISEDLNKNSNSGLGFEMQVLDDDLHPDAKAGKDGNRTAGALYDLIAPAKTRKLNPVGEWNSIAIIVRNGHVEHWMNGGKIVEFEIGSPQMKALIAESKFKVNPGFGEVRKGHILLQDHVDQVWFRNLKVRELH